MDSITQTDFLILDFIHNNLTCRFFDLLLTFFTHLGNGGIIWFIAGFALILSKKYRKSGITMLCAMAFGFLTGNMILKNLIARPRPCWINTDVLLLIENPSDYSFPSGHTLSSVICATVLTLTDRKFGFAAIPAALLIAFSRLYLYVHFPSDVVFSVVYGICIGIVACRIAGKFFGCKSN
ncbi:MAG: phosphatase PAP2 family protein [Ruminococcaceae bacterium]|nr:phosphatase PAP2 family protein [Oscillospiraceae bacterium]